MLRKPGGYGGVVYYGKQCDIEPTAVMSPSVVGMVLAYLIRRGHFLSM